MIFLELFGTFFLIGLFTFGGGYAMIPMIQEQVIGKGWISESNLTDFIAVSEVTPGPFALNISTFVGSTVAGPFGAVCSTLGVILPSLIIIIIVAMIMNKFIKNKYVQGALNGVKPIVLSLILSTALLMFIKVMFFGGNSLQSEFSFDRKSLALFIILILTMWTYKKVNKKSLNPLWILGLSALLGFIFFYFV